MNNDVDIIKIIRDNRLNKSKLFILTDIIPKILDIINDTDDLYIDISIDTFGFSLKYKYKWLGNFYTYKEEAYKIYVNQKNTSLLNKYKSF
jgi:hypothetical protein